MSRPQMRHPEPSRRRFGLSKFKSGGQRAPLSTTPAAFVEQNGLGEVVALVKRLAAEHFGASFAGVRESLGVTEAAEQYVEVEIGIGVPHGEFVAARAEFLRAFRATGVEYDPDRLLISVRMRAPAD